jgi:hypothetical protein
VSPLSATFKLATVPVTVKEAPPLDPVVNVNPLLVASVSVPCATESVSESLLLPAIESASVIALLFAVEKTREVFSTSEPDLGAAIDGADKGLTVMATLAAPDRLSAESERETAKVSGPKYPAVGR